MMLSRKRRYSYIPDSQSIELAKRPKSLSAQHSLRSSASSSQSSTAESSRSSGVRYEIKGILEETEQEYLIDWADDPVTGEVYEPDWQPKGNVDATAVAVWEAQNSPNLTQTPITNELVSSFEPSPESSAEQHTTSQVDYPRKRRHLTRSKALATARRSGSSSQSLRKPRSRRSLSVPLEDSDLADLLVRASQSDSLDRGLYIAIESSLSTSSTQSTVQAGSKANENRDRLQETSSDKEVPDSQPSAVFLRFHSKHPRDTFVPVSASQSSDSLFSAASAKGRKASHLLIPATQVSQDTQTKSVSAFPPTDEKASSGSLASDFPSSLSSSHFDSRYIPISPQELLNTLPFGSLKTSDSVESRPQKPGIKSKSGPDRQDLRTEIVKPNDRGVISDTHYIPSTQEQLDCPTERPDHWHSKIIAGTAIPHITMADTGAYREGHLRSIDDSQPQSQMPSQVRRSSYGNPPPPWGGMHSVGTHHPPSTHLAMTNPEGPSTGFPPLAQMQPATSERRSSQGWTQYIHEQRDERRRHFAEGYHSNHLYQNARSAPQSPMSQRHETSRFIPDVEGNSRDRSRPTPQALPPSFRSPVTQSSLKSLNFTPGPLSPLHKTFSPTESPSPDPADRRMSKSPSVIPDTIPYTAEPEPSRLEARPLEIDTTFRQPPPRVIHPLSLPHTPVTPSKLALQNQVSLSQDETTIKILNTSMREHYVALSMPGRIRDAYCNVVRFYSDSIRPLFNQNPCRPETVEGINKLLDGVSNVTTHLDLQGSGPSSGDHVDAQAEAAYAEACSEKFAFMGHLIDRLRHQKLNVFIAAKRGALMGIIETFLKAKGVAWTKFDENASNSPPRSQNELTVFLIPSDGSYDTSKLQWPEPDTVIGFDETLSLDRVSNFHRSSNPVPIIRLLVYASLEHIDLCVPRDMNPIERLRRLVWILLQTQKRVGALAEHTSRSSAEVAASSIQNHASKRRDRAFMLPEVPPIDDITLMADIDTQDSNRHPYMSEPSGVSRYWPNPIAPTVLSPPRQIGQKRSFDLVWGEPLQKQVKKIRMGSAYHGPFEEFQTQETSESLMSRLDSAKQQINELERSLQKKAAFCTELEQSFSVRQYEYERVRQENSDLKRAHAKTASDLAREQQGLERAVTTKKALQDRNKDIEQQLRDQNAQLQNHPNAIVAANARDEAELDELRKRNATLEKKISSAEADAGYVREQYQQASTAAAEASGTIAELESSQAELQRRLDGQIERLRQAADENIHEKLTKKIQRLEAQSKQRDQLQQRLENEIAELRRGRGGMQTRGSSQQPRSPRGGGSRGVSPAPAFLGGHAMTRAGSGLGSRLGAA